MNLTKILSAGVNDKLSPIQPKDVEEVLVGARQAVKSFVANPEQFTNTTGHPLMDEAGQNALVDMAMRATADVFSSLHAQGQLNILKSNISVFQGMANDAAIFAATCGTGYNEAEVKTIMKNRIRAYGGINLDTSKGSLSR